MPPIDVFNGDADGICALHQLRMHTPAADARLVSGVKRDIKLLDRLGDTGNSHITVLDISLDRNREALVRLLADNNRIFYADHHYAGDIPRSPLLEAHIDPDPLICTSLIIDRLLGGKYRDWAIAAAFGDNLHQSAMAAAGKANLPPETVDSLRELGTLLNYNGYGVQVDDLHFSPVALYREVHRFHRAMDFFTHSPVLAELRSGYEDDMQRAAGQKAVFENNSGRIFRLPAAPWARRVSGVFSNKLAREKPALAHALVVENSDRSLRISVRAPLDNRRGADELCRRFPDGGGRAAAAGINSLPPEMYDEFVREFTATFSRPRPVAK